MIKPRRHAGISPHDIVIIVLEFWLSSPAEARFKSYEFAGASARVNLS